MGSGVDVVGQVWDGSEDEWGLMRILRGRPRNLSRYATRMFGFGEWRSCTDGGGRFEERMRQW